MAAPIESERRNSPKGASLRISVCLGKGASCPLPRTDLLQASGERPQHSDESGQQQALRAATAAHALPAAARPTIALRNLCRSIRLILIDTRPGVKKKIPRPLRFLRFLRSAPPTPGKLAWRDSGGSASPACCRQEASRLRRLVVRRPAFHGTPTRSGLSRRPDGPWRAR